MRIVTIFAIYFIIWWLVLFTVLPWGATSAHESGSEIEPGHADACHLPAATKREIGRAVSAANAYPEAVSGR